MEQPADNICLDCGICCNGTLFTHAGLTEDDDTETLSRSGAVITPGADETTFALPCPAFLSGCCSIYEKRPAVCRSFRCALLRRFDVGEVALDDALALIVTTKDLSARARSEMEAILGPHPEKGVTGLAQILTTRINTSEDPRAARVASADTLADLVALDLLLERHFRNRPARETTMDDPGSGSDEK